MFASDASGASTTPVRRPSYLRVSRMRAVLLALLVVSSWLLIFDLASGRGRAGAISTSRAVAAVAAPRPATTTMPVGPWGELVITPMTIEPPADFAVRFGQADTTKWFFRDCTPEKLAGIVKTAGLTQEQQDAVMRSAVADASINGMVAKPEREIVLGLSREARSALYNVLAADPKNGQAEPFRHRADPADDWFADSGLHPTTLGLARKLLYRRGTMEAFADVSAVMPALYTDDERAKLFRALSRQSALLVKLRVRPDSDVAGLVRYWGRGGRETEIGPLIQSLAKVPGGFSISVTQLMPRFPRARAYTYPEAVDATVNGAYDCHWTSLNFWNRPHDDRFRDPAIVAQELRTNYHMVDKPEQLGDVVFLLNQKDEGIHSATFVAADIVFTKNGSNISAPWLLMKLPDLLAYYENVAPVKVMVFRKNGI